LSVKLAVQVLLFVTATVIGFAVPVQSPLQLLKVEPVLAVAVTWTFVLYGYVPAPLTEPLPLPPVVVASV
jgi:hypothetical protein